MMKHQRIIPAVCPEHGDKDAANQRFIPSGIDVLLLMKKQFIARMRLRLLSSIPELPLRRDPACGFGPLQQKRPPKVKGICLKPNEEAGRNIVPAVFFTPDFARRSGPRMPGSRRGSISGSQRAPARAREPRRVTPDVTSGARRTRIAPERLHSTLCTGPMSGMTAPPAPAIPAQGPAG